MARCDRVTSGSHHQVPVYKAFYRLKESLGFVSQKSNLLQSGKQQHPATGVSWRNLSKSTTVPLRTALASLEMISLPPVLVVHVCGKSLVNCHHRIRNSLLQQACAPNLSPHFCNAKAVVCWCFLRSASVWHVVLTKTTQT